MNLPIRPIAVLMAFLCIHTSLEAMRRGRKTPPPALAPITEEAAQVQPATSVQPATTAATVFLGVRSTHPKGLLIKGIYESVDREDKNIPPRSPFITEQRAAANTLERIEFNRFAQQGQGAKKNYFKLRRVIFIDQETGETVKEMETIELESGNFFYIELTAPEKVRVSRHKPPRSPDSPSTPGKHAPRQKKQSKSAPASSMHSPKSATITPTLSAPEFISVLPPHAPEKSVERPAHAATTPTLPAHRASAAPGDLTTLPEPPPGNASY